MIFKCYKKVEIYMYSKGMKFNILNCSDLIGYFVLVFLLFI